LELRYGRSPTGWRGFLIGLILLSVLYSRTLWAVAQLALHTDLHSHILLIPFVSLYLIWLRKPEWPHGTVAGQSALAVVPLILGLALAGGTSLAARSGLLAANEDYLCLMMISFVSLLVACGLWFFGRKLVASIAFPLVMLLFLAPMPKTLEVALESFFQHASAETASWLFALAGTPVVRDDLVFRLPGLTIHVAPECSGIRSSFVLFITSLLAGYLFLRSPWKRASLTCMVIPLGILRNGFRIFTLGLLCVQVDQGLIDSWIHHKGGPLFFVLSLIPFFLFLLWLRRSESESDSSPASPIKTP
jgi:exosortase C (VPDSG-CTERM-specific)